MEYRAIIVGAKITAKKLAAASGIKPPRKLGDRVWVELPHDSSDRSIDALAKKTTTQLTVIEVEVELGMRCEDLTAWTYEAPGHKRERDLTARATKLFEALELEGAFDEEAAAIYVAWLLAEHVTTSALGREKRPTR